MMVLRPACHACVNSCRFREGLRTLGVFQQVTDHHTHTLESWRVFTASVLPHSGPALSSHLLQRLLSGVGSADGPGGQPILRRELL